MLEQICIRCVISGQVQGVYFRATTKEQALQWGLTGWVRNLANGQVEVLACGPREQIQMLYQWLHQGPRLAQVDQVSYEEVPWEAHPAFVVK